MSAEKLGVIAGALLTLSMAGSATAQTIAADRPFVMAQAAPPPAAAAAAAAAAEAEKKKRAAEQQRKGPPPGKAQAPPPQQPQRQPPPQAKIPPPRVAAPPPPAARIQQAPSPGRPPAAVQANPADGQRQGRPIIDRRDGQRPGAGTAGPAPAQQQAPAIGQRSGGQPFAGQRRPDGTSAGVPPAAIQQVPPVGQQAPAIGQRPGGQPFAGQRRPDGTSAGVPPAAIQQVPPVGQQAPAIGQRPGGQPFAGQRRPDGTSAGVPPAAIQQVPPVGQPAPAIGQRPGGQPFAGQRRPDGTSAGVPPAAIQQVPPVGQTPGGTAAGGGRPGIGAAAAGAAGAAAVVGGAAAIAGQRNPQDTAQGTAPGRPRPNFDELKRGRQERTEGGRTVIQEGNRTIVRQNNRVFIQNDDGARFAAFRGAQVNRRPDGFRETFYVRPDGIRVISEHDSNGRLMRRYRRGTDGREHAIIDNRNFWRNAAIGVGVGAVVAAVAINLSRPAVAMPRSRYIVDYDRASDEDIYEALSAPPVERLDRPYSLEEIRYSPDLRDRMRRVDLDSITFDSGAYDVGPEQFPKLERLARGILRALRNNPDEVFMIEGHTDAVGADVDNLSLSDRRAESVASILSDSFGVPPENLVTQGYGEQFPKVETAGPERLNRRVAVRRITPLMTERQG